MEAEDIDTIEEIFRAVLGLDDSDALDTISRDTRRNWDSMAQVALVSALDDEFDLVISSQDALRINSFASCVSVIEAYLGG